MDLFKFLGILLLVVLILSFLTPVICNYFVKKNKNDQEEILDFRKDEQRKSFFDDDENFDGDLYHGESLYHYD